MKTKHRILAIALAIQGMLIAADRAGALLYDLDFGTPPHTVGLPPVTGAGPAVRETVSAILNGAPTVVMALGAMVDQPCKLDSVDGDGDQFQLDLFDQPSFTTYSLDVDVLVTSGHPSAELTIAFNTPAVRNVRFLGDGTVRIYVPGLPGQTIGNYFIGQIVHLGIVVDLNADLWTITLDGVLAHSGGFGGASAIESVRVSTDVTFPPYALLGAVDNLAIDGEGVVPQEVCDRLGFGDLVAGSTYNVGDSFQTDSVTVHVEPFSTDVGVCAPPEAYGFAEVVTGGSACGRGKEINVNNVSLDFDFGGTVTDVIIPYGEYGGTVSLGVNGDCQVVENFADLSGTSLGGVAVTVFDFDVPGQGCGVVRLGGAVTSLTVGGQEFFVDNLSYCQECPDLVRSAFEDQSLGSVYTVGTSFVSGAATHTFYAFYPPGVDCVMPDPNGQAEIGNTEVACGRGLELGLNNINDRIDFGSSLEWLALNYGEFGGNVNLWVNGDCRNLDNFSDINGSTVGGVTVWAIDYGTPGQSCGALYAVGVIDQFGIGGQELWIDNVRACPIATAGASEPMGQSITEGLRLDPSWPNPAHGAAVLRFALPEASSALVTLFDAGGRAVRTLMDQPAAAGLHEVPWDGLDAQGNRLPAGVYFYRVQAGGRSAAQRLTILP